jgi:hypothetical protein
MGDSEMRRKMSHNISVGYKQGLEVTNGEILVKNSARKI